MSVENVKKFYKRLEEDEAFRTEIANDETMKDVIRDRLIAVAGKHGYEFTATDYATAMEDGELSDSELEKIAGGERVIVPPQQRWTDNNLPAQLIVLNGILRLTYQSRGGNSRIAGQESAGCACGLSFYDAV